MKYFYVITPVGADPEFATKKRVLEEVGRSRGCEPFFPFDHRTVFSLDAVRSDIRNAMFVLADLSYERPSCYFELGLAQALGATVVVVASRGTRLHQVADPDAITWYSDMSDYRALVTRCLAESGYAPDEGQPAAEQRDPASRAARRG